MVGAIWSRGLVVVVVWCVQLPMGRACIEHYRLLKRQCVFSHDELVCRMASLLAGTLDLTMSVMVYQDMVVMVEEERKLRKQLLNSVYTFFLFHCFISLCFSNEVIMHRLVLWLFYNCTWLIVCLLHSLSPFMVPAHPGSPGQKAIKRLCVFMSGLGRMGQTKLLRCILAGFELCACV